MLTKYGITASMSRRGDCWYNACSETLFKSLKVDRLHGQRFKTRRQAMDEVIAWMFSGTTAPDCTRRWPTSARCGSKKTGWPIHPGEPAREPGYAIQILGQDRSCHARLFLLAPFRSPEHPPSTDQVSTAISSSVVDNATATSTATGGAPISSASPSTRSRVISSSAPRLESASRS